MDDIETFLKALKVAPLNGWLSMGLVSAILAAIAFARGERWVWKARFDYMWDRVPVRDTLGVANAIIAAALIYWIFQTENGAFPVLFAAGVLIAWWRPLAASLALFLLERGRLYRHPPVQAVAPPPMSAPAAQQPIGQLPQPRAWAGAAQQQAAPRPSALPPQGTPARHPSTVAPSQRRTKRSVDPNEGM